MKIRVSLVEQSATASLDFKLSLRDWQVLFDKHIYERFLFVLMKNLSNIPSAHLLPFLTCIPLRRSRLWCSDDAWRWEKMQKLELSRWRTSEAGPVHCVQVYLDQHLLFTIFLALFFFWTFTSSKHTSVYRCTSDTSLTIYSTATSSVQMAKDDSVRFQMTNQSGDVSQSERVISDNNNNNPPRATEPLSEIQEFGFFGRSQQIVESFNMDDFWHALFLGKYFFCIRNNNQMCLTNCNYLGRHSVIKSTVKVSCQLPGMSSQTSSLGEVR